MDIQYSFRATERYIYEYAKYLHEHGKDVEILITEKKEWAVLLQKNKAA
jgi:hypothetical protein